MKGRISTVTGKSGYVAHGRNFSCKMKPTDSEDRTALVEI